MAHTLSLTSDFLSRQQCSCSVVCAICEYGVAVGCQCLQTIVRPLYTYLHPKERHILSEEQLPVRMRTPTCPPITVTVKAPNEVLKFVRP